MKLEKSLHPSFLALIAISRNVIDKFNNNIPENKGLTYEQLKDFLLQSQKILHGEPEVYRKYFRNAFRAIAIKVITSSNKDDKEILQTLYKETKGIVC